MWSEYGVDVKFETSRHLSGPEGLMKDVELHNGNQTREFNHSLSKNPYIFFQ